MKETRLGISISLLFCNDMSGVIDSSSFDFGAANVVYAPGVFREP